MPAQRCPAFALPAVLVAAATKSAWGAGHAHRASHPAPHPVDAGATVAFLAVIVAAVAVGVYCAWHSAHDWIERYTREHVKKRAAGMASSVALGVFVLLLLPLGTFVKPFYQIPPINQVFDLARHLLSPPPAGGIMPNLKTLYFWFHVTIAGAVSALVVVAGASSIATKLASGLHRTRPLA